MLCRWKWNLLTKEKQVRCFHQQKHLHVPVSKSPAEGKEQGDVGRESGTGGQLVWWRRDEMSRCSPLRHLCSLEGARLPPQAS